MPFVSHKNLPKGPERKFTNVLLQKMSVKKKIKFNNGEKNKQSLHNVVSYHQEIFAIKFLFFWCHVYICLCYFL